MCSQLHHQGEFQQESISARRRSQKCGQNLCGPGLPYKLYCQQKSKRALSWQEDKSGHNSTIKASYSNKIIRLGQPQQQSSQCSQNPCRPLVRSITLRGTISPLPGVQGGYIFGWALIEIARHLKCKYLLQVLFQVEGDTVVGGKENGEILRLLQSKGIHIAPVQDSLCPAYTKKVSDIYITYTSLAQSIGSDKCALCSNK